VLQLLLSYDGKTHFHFNPVSIFTRFMTTHYVILSYSTFSGGLMHRFNDKIARRR
jgi:hypothetical protein